MNLRVAKFSDRLYAAADGFADTLHGPVFGVPRRAVEAWVSAQSEKRDPVQAVAQATFGTFDLGAGGWATVKAYSGRLQAIVDSMRAKAAA